MTLQGFDRSFYLKAKLAALQAAGPGWADKDIADLEALLQNSFGMTPEMHYRLYGCKEGLAPNAFFDHGEYRLAKAADMVAKGQSPDTDLALSLLDASWPHDLYLHYIQYGAAEGINPSNDFDESEYLSDKLSVLQSAQSTAAQWSGKTIDNLRTVINAAGMNVISHYISFGSAEGLTITLVPENEKVQAAPTLPHGGVELPPDLNLTWVDNTEITTAPHKAIGQVRVDYGTQIGLGTGFLISPEHVLTNAHVVLNDAGELDPNAGITFLPGLNGDPSGAVSFNWEKTWVQHSFASPDTYPEWPDNDLAVIRLDRAAAPDRGVLSMEKSVNLTLINTPLQSAGYSAENIEQDNPATPGRDYYQWEVSGSVDRYLLGNGVLDLSEGMGIAAGGSGSPLYYYGQDGTPYFTGVLSGNLGGDTVAAAIDRDSYNWILGILQQDGYYPDYTPV